MLLAHNDRARYNEYDKDVQTKSKKHIYFYRERYDTETFNYLMEKG